MTGVSFVDVVSACILLVTIFNSWQRTKEKAATAEIKETAREIKLEIAQLKIWILRNFVMKGGSVAQELDRNA